MMPNDCQMYQTKSFPSSCPNQKHPCTSGRGSCTLEGTSPCLPSKSISCTSPSRALWILSTFSGSEACSSLSSSKICEALKVETNLKHRKEKMHCSIVVKWLVWKSFPHGWTKPLLNCAVSSEPWWKKALRTTPLPWHPILQPDWNSNITPSWYCMILQVWNQLESARMYLRKGIY